MSEQRQLVLLLVGLLVLTTVGVVGATLFPEPCEELEQLGELELRFADAADVVAVEPVVADELEALGDRLGVGSWRGAVALSPQAEVLRSEFGFFVVAEEDFAVLRPSLGIASAARGRAGLDVLPAGTSLALRAADGTTGVFNGEYELDRCGELPPDADVLALDRGVAVVADGDDVVLRTFSGEESWRAPSVDAAHITGDGVVLSRDGQLELRTLRDGAVLDHGLDTTGPVRLPWVDARGPALLLPADGAVVPVTDAARELRADTPVLLPLSGVTDAVRTPGGIVAAGVLDGEAGTVASAVASDRATAAVELPASLQVVGLHASEDGHVGIVVDHPGGRALLVYGPDRASIG